MKIFFGQIFLSTASLLATLATANAETVAQSGNWSSANTWGGTVPVTSSDTPMSVLQFGANNLNLNVDANQFAYYLDTAANTYETINIASGTTLTLAGGQKIDSAFTLSTTNLATNTVHFTGDGILQLGRTGVSTSESFFKKGNYIFDVVVNSKISAGFLDNSLAGSATFNKDYTTTGQLSVGGGWTITVAAGVKMNIASALTIWGSNANSKFLVKEGATVTSNVNGAYLSNAIIDGNIISKGAQNWERSYTLRLQNATFNATSSLSQAKSNSLVATFKGDIISNAGVGKLVIGSDVYMQDSTTLTLNTSGAFKIGGAATQAESNFFVAKQVYNPDFSVKFEAAKFTISLGADNAFNIINFYEGSSLTVIGNGHQFLLGGFGLMANSTNFTVLLSKLTDFTIKVNSLANIETYTDADSNLRSTNVKFSDADDFTDEVFIIEDTANGGWWLNSSNVVPEPAAVASVLGLLAIAFAFARRPRK